MTKDHAVLTMTFVASISFAIWTSSIFAGTFVFGLISVYNFTKGWK